MRIYLISIFLIIPLLSLEWSCNNPNNKQELNSKNYQLDSINNILLIANQKQISNPDTAIQLYNYCATKYQKLNKPENLINCYYKLTFVYCYTKKDLEQGLAIVNLAKQLEPNIDRNITSKIAYCEGIYHMAKEEYLQATTKFIEAISNADSVTVDPGYWAELHSSIANIYITQKNFKKAFEYYQPVIKYSLEGKSPSMNTIALINAYVIASEIGDEQNAVQYLHDADSIYKQSNCNSLKSIIYYNFAFHFKKINNYDSSIDYAKKSIQNIKNQNPGLNKPEKPYLLLAELWLLMGKTDSAVHIVQNIQTQFDSSKFEMSDKIEYNKLLFELYKSKNQINYALNALLASTYWRDSLHKIEIDELLSNFEQDNIRVQNDRIINLKDLELKKNLILI